MKYGIILILLSVLSLAGCGSFVEKFQTYRVHEIDIKKQKRPKPRLLATIIPSTSNFVIPFVHHLQKWGAPYSLRLVAYPSWECTHYLLHSFRVKLAGKLVDEKSFKTPLKLDACKKVDGNPYLSILYTYEFGSSLVFTADKRIELEVIYSHADIAERITIFMKGIGHERKTKQSLWDFMMSV